MHKVIRVDIFQKDGREGLQPAKFKRIDQGPSSFNDGECNVYSPGFSVESRHSVDCSVKETLIPVEFPQPYDIRPQDKRIEVHRVATEVAADIPQEFPEPARGLFRLNVFLQDRGLHVGIARKGDTSYFVLSQGNLSNCGGNEQRY